MPSPPAQSSVNNKRTHPEKGGFFVLESFHNFLCAVFQYRIGMFANCLPQKFKFRQAAVLHCPCAGIGAGGDGAAEPRKGSHIFHGACKDRADRSFIKAAFAP